MERITQADIEDMRSCGCEQSAIADAESWLQLCLQADKLIEQVIEAFEGVRLGNGIGLRESDGIDDYAGADELRELRDSDETLDWRKISPGLLNYCHAAPSFLDAKGLLFHTPAFIVAELRGQLGQGMIDRLIFNSFTAPEFTKLLTADQRHVIIACISFYGSIDRFHYDPTAGVPDQYHFLYAGGVGYDELENAWSRLPYTEIVLERTECYGTCPSYIVTLHANGAATFNGRRYSARTGLFNGDVGIWDYGQICWLIDRYKILDGPREYSANWTDSATTIVRIKLRETGETIEISDYGGQGPVELWSLFNAIDAVSGRTEWIPQTE